jgi:hypothetical protein
MGGLVPAESKEFLEIFHPPLLFKKHKHYTFCLDISS